MSTYEPIMNALLAYLQTQITAQATIPIFNTYRRGIVQWEQLGQLQNGLPIVRQPALFLYDGMGFGGGVEMFHRAASRATPPVRTLTRTIVLYAQSGAAGGLPGGSLGGIATANTTTSQANILHPLIEAVEAALIVPDNPETGTVTLGGLVAYCRIEGKAFLSSPDIDPEGQGMATLPIEIRLP